MDTTALADRIRDFVAKVNRPVSLTQLKDRTKDICTVRELLDALAIVHRLKDITVTVRNNDNWYSIKKLPTARVTTGRYRPTPEQRSIMDAESRDFWEHSPLVTDEERSCYYASMTDTNRWKTCLCDTCIDMRHLSMTREERAMEEFIRQRNVIMEI
jgi:hypothetical protein